MDIIHGFRLIVIVMDKLHDTDDCKFRNYCCIFVPFNRNEIQIFPMLIKFFTNNSRMWVLIIADVYHSYFLQFILKIAIISEFTVLRIESRSRVSAYLTVTAFYVEVCWLELWYTLDVRVFLLIVGW